jgi:hypothetical protein
VIQPGSTVATSLVDGESQPKHLMVLDIKGGDFRLTNHRLQNVRSFITEEIRLDDEEYGLDPEDCKVEKQIDLLLEDHVKSLVERVRRERAVALLQDKEMSAPDNKLCILQEPKQVLVRLKVFSLYLYRSRSLSKPPTVYVYFYFFFVLLHFFLSFFLSFLVFIV